MDPIFRQDKYYVDFPFDISETLLQYTMSFLMRNEHDDIEL